MYVTTHTIKAMCFVTFRQINKSIRGLSCSINVIWFVTARPADRRPGAAGEAGRSWNCGGPIPTCHALRLPYPRESVWT